jgi:hypothetical protein
MSSLPPKIFLFFSENIPPPRFFLGFFHLFIICISVRAVQIRRAQSECASAMRNEQRTMNNAFLQGNIRKAHPREGAESARQMRFIPRPLSAFFIFIIRSLPFPLRSPPFTHCALCVVHSFVISLFGLFFLDFVDAEMMLARHRQKKAAETAFFSKKLFKTSCQIHKNKV